MSKQKMVPRSVAVGIGVAGAFLVVGQFIWWNQKCPNVLKKSKY